MKREKTETSIIGRLSSATRHTALVLLLPVLFSLTVAFTTSARYQQALSRMETAAALKPSVGTRLPEQLFSVAAGRLTFDESGAEAILNEIDQTLDRLLSEDGASGALELTVARRTMDTLASYVNRVREDMARGLPVSEVERVVDEVRDVGDLITDMLDNYISVQVEDAVKTGASLRRLVYITALCELLLLAVAMGRAAYSSMNLASVIRRAIDQLEGSVQRITGGNLTARVGDMDVVEFRELAQQINVMANRLESLIEQSRQEQENLAKAELRLLQAQINPHFLYNTLDTIIWQAESGQSEAVIHLTRSLSDFFRISLSSGADWITVERETRHLTGYLSIQKTRYRDILNYEIDIPPDMAEGYIVKLLLQPLVENALYHGIKNRRGGGFIRVSARHEGENVRFCVEDTGSGMSPEVLSKVLSDMRSDGPPLAATPSGGGFGLRNVDMRIRLYYHQDEGLQIQSGPGGTAVSFCVPLKSREAITDDEGISG